MRFEDFLRGEAWCFKVSGAEEIKLHLRVIALKKLVAELLFGISCSECNRMAAIPQGAFAVLQVRKNFNRSYTNKFQIDEEEETKNNKNNCGFSATKVLQEGRELTPLKYNSKLMNSIWGLYNRYSVHNFKKIDANENGNFLEAAWGALSSGGSATVVAAEGSAAAIGANGH